MSRDSFVQFVREALLTMPQTLKAMLRIVEDSEVSDEGRALAAGALIHWLSSAKTIPGVSGILGYVDDVLLIELVFGRLESIVPDAVSRHLADLPEGFFSPSESIEVMRDYLGPAIAVFEKAADEVGKLKYKGRTIDQYIGDEQASDRLYHEVQSALVELDVEEAEVLQAVKGLDAIFETIRRRV
jgi:uncharacterized membrane protein YkvA (DUF1232 family)